MRLSPRLKIVNKREMGRPPCCDKSNTKKGLWTAEEDAKILTYVATHGAGNWSLVPKLAGLQRCGKSCRLRWTNYLRPDLKHEGFTPEEEELIIRLHAAFGSRWSVMAKQLPGRTDNEIKNHWNTKIRKKLVQMGIDPVTHKPLSQLHSDHKNIQVKYGTSPFLPNVTDGITCLNIYQKQPHLNPLECYEPYNYHPNLRTTHVSDHCTSSYLLRPGKGLQSIYESYNYINHGVHILGSSSSNNLQEVIGFTNEGFAPHMLPTTSSSSTSSCIHSCCWTDQFLSEEAFLSLTQSEPCKEHLCSPKPSTYSPKKGSLTTIGSEIRIGTDNCKIEGSSTNLSFVDAMLENHNNMLQQLPIYFSTLD